jgi:hypothetical protein
MPNEMPYLDEELADSLKALSRKGLEEFLAKAIKKWKQKTLSF